MAWKVITFLAIFALSEARPPTSKQRVKIENWLSHVKYHEAEPQEVYYDSAYPSYEFSYEVSDPHTHDFKGQYEQRKGDDVKGHYWLIQPDGLKRTVKYHADKHSGFKANVEYIKHWEEEKKKQEGEGEVNQEENSSETENSEENENGQENESNGSNENESEGEGETENNDSGVEEGEENEEGEEESENQEGEQSELREAHWKRGRNNLDRKNYGRRDNRHGHELKATTGIWQPNRWSKHHRNEELRYVRSNERYENIGEREKRGHARRGSKSRNEKKESNKNEKKNEKSEQKEEKKEKKEEERRESNKNEEGNVENKNKGKVQKSEYYVTIHHPKHSK